MRAFAFILQAGHRFFLYFGSIYKDIRGVKKKNMETIRVVLCGTDAFAVEGYLHGSAVKRHSAWNRMYNFSCVSALSVDRIDRRSLLSSHVVVLGKGARPCEKMELYAERPVISTTECPQPVLESFKGCSFYYGTVALEDLQGKLLEIGLNPPHILYNRATDDLTPLGECAYRRAFWIFDRKCTGTLDRSAVLVWRKQVETPNVPEDELLAPFVEFCEKQGMPYTAFKSFHLGLLRESRDEDAWATLQVVGTDVTGLPYTLGDLQALRSDGDNCNLYLSTTAIHFFSNIFRLKRFKEQESIWGFTPGCPWSAIGGLPQAGFSLEAFIGCWKYMALHASDSVIKYARYWGYKGEAGALLIRRNSRAFRDKNEVLPNTIHVVVAGAKKTGKKRLVSAISHAGGQHDGTALDNHYHNSCQHHPHDPHQSSDDVVGVFVQTASLESGDEGDEAVGVVRDAPTVVYTVPQPDSVVDMMRESGINKTIDAVVLCYDCTNITKSARYIIDLYQELSRCQLCSGMPFVLVCTKADAPPRNSRPAQRNAEVLEEFCKERQLLWPPVMTSADCPQQFELKALSNLMAAAVRDPMITVAAPPVTPVRLLRRITFGAIVFLALAEGIWSLAN